MALTIDTSSPGPLRTSYCSTHDTCCVCVEALYPPDPSDLDLDRLIAFCDTLLRELGERKRRASRMHRAYRSRTLRRNRRG